MPHLYPAGASEYEVSRAYLWSRSRSTVHQRTAALVLRLSPRSLRWQSGPSHSPLESSRPSNWPALWSRFNIARCMASYDLFTAHRQWFQILWTGRRQPVLDGKTSSLLAYKQNSIIPRIYARYPSGVNLLAIRRLGHYWIDWSLYNPLNGKGEANERGNIF